MTDNFEPEDYGEPAISCTRGGERHFHQSGSEAYYCCGLVPVPVQGESTWPDGWYDRPTTR